MTQRRTATGRRKRALRSLGDGAPIDAEWCSDRAIANPLGQHRKLGGHTPNSEWPAYDRQRAADYQARPLFGPCGLPMDRRAVLLLVSSLGSGPARIHRNAYDDAGLPRCARLKAPALQRYHNAGDAQLTAGATPFMKAVKTGDLEVMRLLLDKGASATLTTSNYTTALMFAAGLGGGRGRTTDAEALEAIELCLKAGADIDAFNSNGQTAMHIAVERSDVVVKFLAEHGAALELKDKYGRTPLDVALGVPAGAAGGRGAAPPRPRESTVALLRQLIGRVDAATPTRQ